MDRILEKIRRMDSYFRLEEKTEKERFLERIVKLNEEVGELCEAALCEVDTNQREKEKKIDFDGELSDVIICCMLLANQRNVDILERIEDKLNSTLKRMES